MKPIEIAERIVVDAWSESRFVINNWDSAMQLMRGAWITMLWLDHEEATEFLESAREQANARADLEQSERSEAA